MMFNDQQRADHARWAYYNIGAQMCSRRPGQCMYPAAAYYARLPICRHCGERFVSLLGAGSDAGRFCNACAQYEGFENANEPQGETVRLFEPAPAQMPGQIPLSDHGRFLAAWHSGRTGHPSARNRF